MDYGAQRYVSVFPVTPRWYEVCREYSAAGEGSAVRRRMMRAALARPRRVAPMPRHYAADGLDVWAPPEPVRLDYVGSLKPDYDVIVIDD